MAILLLKNPHSILAALESRPKEVLEVSIPSKQSLSDIWQKIYQQAVQKRIPIVNHPSISSAGPSAGQTNRSGGLSASVKERASLALEELFRVPSVEKGVWLALDGLQDPQNVGAIFRSAAFFGVRGVLLTQERSAPLTAAAYDTASGGLESVPFSIQANLQRAFEKAKEAGLWILGTSEHVTDSFRSVQADRPWLIVLGNEEKGMRRLTEEGCDVLCGVLPVGKVKSLNVSVAAGILLSHFLDNLH